ncbi:major facilitator superfamily domain-containing protein [Phyllosticta citriasiana]|uniref:major facilitator superfamily domain-containing protein n=1 Tax=Phyllosticta citriasiana TaxID=595635 RepID=UPI0030FD51B6
MSTSSSTDKTVDDETSPLLSPSPSPSPSSSSSFFSTSTSTRPDHHDHHRRRWRPTAICHLLLLVVVCHESADVVAGPALTRIYEAVYCRQYYARRGGIGGDGGGGVGGVGGIAGVPEEYCKVPQVQGEVALLKAWQVFFDAAGSLPFAIPWSYFADSYGRKPMLLIVVAAFFAKSVWIQVVCYCWRTLPIRLVWLGGLHSIFGGGAVAGAVLYTSIADVTDQDERVNVFFRFGAAQLFINFVATPLSASLMQFGPFTPTAVGSVIFFFSFTLVCFLPETMNYKEAPEPTSPEPTEAGSCGGTEETTIPRRVKSLFKTLQHSAAFLTSDTRILVLLPSYSVHLLLYNTTDLLLQYTSARYRIPISRATLVVSLQAGLVMMTLLLVLPALAHHLTKRMRFAAQRKDLILARWSAAAMGVGFLGIGLAPSLPWLVAALPVQVVGWGVMFLIRSLVTSFVEQHHVARLYTVLTLVDAAGLMAGTPALAGLFDWGLSVGSWASGLPFVACAGALAAVGVVLSWIRLDEKTGEEDAEGERSLLLSGA